MIVEFIMPDHPRWADAAGHIRTVFHASHGARVAALPAELAVAIGRNGKVLGAAGMRFAEDGFFSQCYLDRPVAEVLGGADGGPVDADDIIEVVSMACGNPVAMLVLVEAITDEGRRRGKGWGLFTATSRLWSMFERSGQPLLRLAPADPARVADPAVWGSYYASDPWVCAIRDSRAERLQFLPPRAGRPGMRLACG